MTYRPDKDINTAMDMNNYDELARLVTEARGQYVDFCNGKKVAATRARKALQEIRNIAQEARKQILELKKGEGESAG